MPIIYFPQPWFVNGGGYRYTNVESFSICSTPVLCDLFCPTDPGWFMRFASAALGNIPDASDRARKTPPHFSLSGPTVSWRWVCTPVTVCSFQEEELLRLTNLVDLDGLLLMQMLDLQMYSAYSIHQRYELLAEVFYFPYKGLNAIFIFSFHVLLSQLSIWHSSGWIIFSKLTSVKPRLLNFWSHSKHPDKSRNWAYVFQFD